MAGNDLQRQLMDDGIKLLGPPFSIDELLSLLDRIGVCLLMVSQSPPGPILASLSPLRSALVSDKLLRHCDTDVKVSVAFCISEIMRITAPHAPYDDAQMKEIFLLIVAVFQKLSHTSSCCYAKAVSILSSMAVTRAIVVMMDLECNALITEMFHIFLETIRSNNSHAVMAPMVQIMTAALLETDEISMEILVPLLASVQKENQNISSGSWILGKEVIRNAAERIQPYILEAVYRLGVPVDHYDEIVGSICQSASDLRRCSNIREQPIDSECLANQLLELKGRYRTVSRTDSHMEAGDEGQSTGFPSPGSPSSQGENDIILSPSGKAFVHGYEVKPSYAPLLRAIFAKHGDIAEDCQHTSRSVRASLLEIVCDIISQLQSIVDDDAPLAIFEMRAIQNLVRRLEATQMKVSWLSEPLARICHAGEEKMGDESERRRDMLKSAKLNCMMVIKGATKEVEEAMAELVAAQKRVGECERRVSAMKLVAKRIDDALAEVEDEKQLWLRQIKELL